MTKHDYPMWIADRTWIVKEIELTVLRDGSLGMSPKQWEPAHRAVCKHLLTDPEELKEADIEFLWDVLSSHADPNGHPPWMEEDIKSSVQHWTALTALADEALVKQTNHCILIRQELADETEAAEAANHLPTVISRCLVPKDSIVIPRYACLPFYPELIRDLATRGAKPINSYEQHRFAADLTQWYPYLEDITPRTWETWGNLPEGSFVVKGKTTSRKDSWASLMFCETKADVPRVAMALLRDSLIKEQGVVIRQYVPLKKLDEGLNGLPVTNEWRVFCWFNGTKPKILARGFYWRASHPEAEAAASWSKDAAVLAYKAAERVGPHIPFFVLDLAETATGDWIVVEVNDGSQSGLCGVSAEELYCNLARVLA